MILTDQDYDLAVMYPGEVVIDFGTAAGGSAVVYPLGLVHLRTHTTQVNAVYASLASMRDSDEVYEPEDAAAALVDVLLASAGRLLSACTVPQLTDPVTPLARAAAESWVRQSFGHELKPEPVPVVDDDPADEPDGPRRPATLRSVLAGLAAAGHPIADVLGRRQVGPDGRELPYPGWTLRQVGAWARASAVARDGEHALTTSDLVAAIAGTFGSDQGRQMLKDHIAALRRA